MTVFLLVRDILQIGHSGIASIFEVGWAQWVWWLRSPSGLQGQTHSGGMGAKPPEARYVYPVCSRQKHFPSSIEHRLNNTLDNFTDVWLHSIASQKKLLSKCQNLPSPRWNGHMPTHGYASVWNVGCPSCHPAYRIKVLKNWGVKTDCII